MLLCCCMAAAGNNNGAGAAAAGQAGNLQHVPLGATATESGGGGVGETAAADSPSTIGQLSDMTLAQKSIHQTLPRYYNHRLITLDVHVILQTESGGSVVSSNCTIPLEVATRMLDLAMMSDLYLLCVVSSDEEERVIRTAVENAGLIQSSGCTEERIERVKTIPSHKLMFASTVIGKRAMIRQLEPHVHIDHDFETVKELDRFKQIKRLLYFPKDDSSPNVAAPGLEIEATSNILQGTSFSTFFDLLAINAG